MYVVSNQSFSKEKSEYRSTETEKTICAADEAESVVEKCRPTVRVTGGRLSAGTYSDRLCAAESYKNAVKGESAIVTEDGTRRAQPGQSKRLADFRPHVHRTDRLAGMACTEEKKRSVLPAALLIMSAAFAAGFVTGCVVWSKGCVGAQCARLAEGCLGYMREGNTFSVYLAAAMRCLLPFTAVLALSALFAGGFLVCPAVMLVRGAGAAVLLCSLMSDHGAFTAAAVFTAMGTAVLITASADAARVSLAATGGGRTEYLRFAARLALYAAALLICSAAYAVMMVMLNR